MPTGSAIQSVDDWRENLDSGLHLQGGSITRYEHNAGHYTYIEADLTAAYNNPHYDNSGADGKTDRVLRTLLYLYPEDRLLVYDRVSALDPHYRKKWLLHTVNRPQIEDLQILRGSANNGILESSAASAIVSNGRGFLKLDRFYPRDAVLRLVGGADYQYYIESDGDDTTLDGKNYVAGAANKPWFDIGYWRIEIQPGQARRDDVFLVALSPNLDAPASEPLQALNALSDNIYGVVSPHSVSVFIDAQTAAEARFQLPAGPAVLLAAGIAANAAVELSTGSDSRNVTASANGIVQFDLTGSAAAAAVLNWH
jgi:hypothetical protein